MGASGIVRGKGRRRAAKSTLELEPTPPSKQPNTDKISENAPSVADLSVGSRTSLQGELNISRMCQIAGRTKNHSYAVSGSNDIQAMPCIRSEHFPLATGRFADENPGLAKHFSRGITGARGRGRLSFHREKEQRPTPMGDNCLDTSLETRLAVKSPT